jgi:phosphoserine aminotransferase
MIETEKQVIHNFNSGPSILPREVFEEASAAVLEFNNTGLSILEIGHRTPEFESIMEEARSLVRELMKLDADHEVLFLHGGATTQFMQVPMNLLNENALAAYTETGTWANKAIKKQDYLGMLRSVDLRKALTIRPFRKTSLLPKPRVTCTLQLMKRLQAHNGTGCLMIAEYRW